MKKSTFAFIDAQNLNLGVRSQGWKLEFARFRIFLADKYKVEKAFIFIGFVEDNQLLYTYLQESGFICVFKPTLRTSKHKKIKVKGNVDAELVLRTMIEYKNYDKAIIISGDGDFHCLVEYLDEKGKLLKIIVPNRNYSSLLRRFREYIIHVGDFRSKVEETKKRGSNLRTKP
ncbi:MAG TPA: NYN domain-containing protein [Candidatus Saccharimonadales bacterium]|nr:NYN domain-containing protein [Candidatus Saccharimonadales bacterium]